MTIQLTDGETESTIYWAPAGADPADHTAWVPLGRVAKHDGFLVRGDIHFDRPCWPGTLVAIVRLGDHQYALSKVDGRPGLVSRRVD